MVHSRTMKIVMYTMKPRLRASLEARRAGVFFNCLFLIHHRVDCLRGDGNHRTLMNVKINLVSCLNSSIFMGNHFENSNVPEGFTPATGASTLR